MQNPSSLSLDISKALSKISVLYGKGDLNLHGYCGSDMARDVDTRKSTYGYIYTLVACRGVISWSSKVPDVLQRTLFQGPNILIFSINSLERL